MTPAALRLAALVAPVLLAATATPARAATLVETFGQTAGQDFAGWEDRWFGTRSTATNYYVTEFGDPADSQGAPDNTGLVLSDGVPSGTNDAIRVLFLGDFAASLREFRLDVASSLAGLTLTFFDLDGRDFRSVAVNQSASDPDTGTPLGYQGIAVASATGIGGFAFSAPAKSQVIVDNLVAVTADAAAVPEPSTWATMILGLGAAGGVVRRRRVRVRFA